MAGKRDASPNHQGGSPNNKKSKSSTLNDVLDVNTLNGDPLAAGVNPGTSDTTTEPDKTNDLDKTSEKPKKPYYYKDRFAAKDDFHSLESHVTSLTSQVGQVQDLLHSIFGGNFQPPPPPASIPPVPPTLSTSSSMQPLPTQLSHTMIPQTTHPTAIPQQPLTIPPPPGTSPPPLITTTASSGAQTSVNSASLPLLLPGGSAPLPTPHPTTPAWPPQQPSLPLIPPTAFAHPLPMVTSSAPPSALPYYSPYNTGGSSSNMVQQLLPPSVSPSTNLISIPISDRAQNKIMQGHYIDFSELLTSPQSSVSTAAPPSIINTPAGLFMVPQEPAKKNSQLTEQEWFKAFATFQYYHNKAFPHEAQQLVVYGHYITTMMGDNLNWRFYDNAFRWERQSQAIKTRWDQFHQILWSRSLLPTTSHADSITSSSTQGSTTKSHASRKVTFPDGQQQRTYSIPAGHCFNWHDPATHCANIKSCPYLHQCPECRNTHTITRHFALQNNTRPFPPSQGKQRHPKPHAPNPHKRN